MVCLYGLGQSSPHELAFGVELDPGVIYLHGQLHEPSMDGKCTRSATTDHDSCPLPQSSQLMESAAPLQPPYEHECDKPTTILHTSGGDLSNPLFFPWKPQPIQGHAAKIPPSNIGTGRNRSDRRKWKEPPKGRSPKYQA
ncbi:hypothetical protein HAX54_015545 [Datura stramonium]|uniref:Uncharacterized protein n=1 Tax=Datura stramonium TaxID=4076 RepID=A0ABS8TSB0_DATST|nr:hypothetical protein [Datura stramonium]